MNKPKLGDKVRDRVTGFEGVITTISSHITGCDTCWVTPGLDKDGKLREANAFDVTRVDILTPHAVTIGRDERAAMGAG